MIAEVKSGEKIADTSENRSKKKQKTERKIRIKVSKIGIPEKRKWSGRNPYYLRSVCKIKGRAFLD